MIARTSVLIGILVLAVGLVTPALAADGDRLEVTFMEQSDSGLSGTATLVEQGGSTTVTVSLSDTSSTVAMPSHIHAGTCANLDPAPAYPLNNVVQGSAETTVDVTIATLLASPFAINVHKSAEEVSTYVACADLVASDSGSQVMPNTGASTGGTTLLVPIALAGLIVFGAGIALQRRRVA